ncbi:MAG TPA: hypothetical protein VGL99_14100, partial [Chloroflexota bacterium]
LLALEMLRLRGDAGATIGELALIYEQQNVKRALAAGQQPFRTPEDWITWPMVVDLVTRDIEARFRITAKGEGFLGFIRFHSMTFDRPF